LTGLLGQACASACGAAMHSAIKAPLIKPA
jgi:hypothetical protein